MVLKLFPEGLTTGSPPAGLTGVKAKVTRPADQTQFTNEDVNKVEIYLDNILQEKGSTSEFTYWYFNNDGLNIVWLGGVVVGCQTCNNRSRVRIPATSLSSATLEKLLTHVPRVTKQYNLVPANGRWCLEAGKVTVGLASHRPRVKHISGSPPTGSRPWRGRWTSAYTLLWSNVDFAFILSLMLKVHSNCLCMLSTLGHCDLSVTQDIVNDFLQVASVYLPFQGLTTASTALNIWQFKVFLLLFMLSCILILVVYYITIIWLIAPWIIYVSYV